MTEGYKLVSTERKSTTMNLTSKLSVYAIVAGLSVIATISSPFPIAAWGAQDQGQCNPNVQCSGWGEVTSERATTAHDIGEHAQARSQM